MTAYAALLGPAALYLLWTNDDRPFDYAQGRRTTTDDRQLSRWSSIIGWWPVAGRGLALAALAFGLSGAAQVYFFLRSGFLDEMLKRATGFQVNEFVGLSDALGITATFNRESLAADMRLVAAATAFGVALGLAAIIGRRAPLLAAMMLGAAIYQGYTAARAYHYGFYKGISFEITVFTLLIAAGAALLWELTATRRQEREDRKQKIGDGRMLARVSRLAAGAGLALLVALNGWTVWGIQERYTASGPQLWSIDEAAATGLRASVPPEATVLVAPDGRSAVFNSLLSYALLGHTLSGQFKTGYGAIDVPARDQPPDLALIPDTADPTSYGYRGRTGGRRRCAGLRAAGRPGRGHRRPARPSGRGCRAEHRRPAGLPVVGAAARGVDALGRAPARRSLRSGAARAGRRRRARHRRD
jgi:hypothetical protein